MVNLLYDFFVLNLMFNLSLVELFDVIKRGNSILAVQLHSDFSRCLIGAIACRHIVKGEVTHVIHVKERLLIVENFLLGRGVKKLELVMDVLILVVSLICGVRDENRVHTAKKLSLILQVLLHKLLPELFIALFEGHNALVSLAKCGYFFEKSLTVCLL